MISAVFMITGCKNTKQAELTTLGIYSPNWFIGYDEKLHGKIEKVTEKLYWGEADGDTVQKGNQITSKEADSLGWGYAWEMTFDNLGNPLSCSLLDENNKYVGGWKMFQMNNILDSAVWKWGDTISTYQKIKCNEKGRIIGASQYRSNVDTLMLTWTESINKTGDTIEYQMFNNKGVLTWRFLKIYNEKGQVKGTESYANGIFSGLSNLIYNENSDLSSGTFFDKDKKVENIMNRSYEYDDQGNWIRMVSKDNHGGINVHERTYSYFQ